LSDGCFDVPPDDDDDDLDGDGREGALDDGGGRVGSCPVDGPALQLPVEDPCRRRHCWPFAHCPSFRQPARHVLDVVCVPAVAQIRPLPPAVLTGLHSASLRHGDPRPVVDLRSESVAPSGSDADGGDEHAAVAASPSATTAPVTTLTRARAPCPSKPIGKRLIIVTSKF
jgi:hypothetical protein